MSFKLRETMQTDILITISYTKTKVQKMLTDFQRVERYPLVTAEFKPKLQVLVYLNGEE
jgi:hypothetical protein